jgi:hypothetical protein
MTDHRGGGGDGRGACRGDGRGDGRGDCRLADAAGPRPGNFPKTVLSLRCAIRVAPTQQHAMYCT